MGMDAAAAHAESCAHANRYALLPLLQACNTQAVKSVLTGLLELSVHGT